MIYSIIEEESPIILCDFQYLSCLKAVDYAKSQGYDVHIFAPGFRESLVCNPLDFLKNSDDAETARQLAAIFQKNFQTINNFHSDTCSIVASQQLIQAVLMLTKELSEFSDIVTSLAILESENFVSRLIAANLNPWLQIAFGQLFSCANTRIAAGIIATTSLMFSSLLAEDTSFWFIGETTLPLDIQSKQMIVFGLEQKCARNISPLFASTLYMTVAKNITKEQRPLIVALPELTGASLTNQFEYLNRQRGIFVCNHVESEKFTDEYNLTDGAEPVTQRTLANKFNFEQRTNEINRRFPL